MRDSSLQVAPIPRYRNPQDFEDFLRILVVSFVALALAWAAAFPGPVAHLLKQKVCVYEWFQKTVELFLRY